MQRQRHRHTGRHRHRHRHSVAANTAGQPGGTFPIKRGLCSFLLRAREKERGEKKKRTETEEDE
eukprot:2056636-Rhodomonas_salina.6